MLKDDDRYGYVLAFEADAEKYGDHWGPLESIIKQEIGIPRGPNGGEDKGEEIKGGRASPAPFSPGRWRVGLRAVAYQGK